MLMLHSYVMILMICNTFQLLVERVTLDRTRLFIAADFTAMIPALCMEVLKNQEKNYLQSWDRR